METCAEFITHGWVERRTADWGLQGNTMVAVWLHFAGLLPAPVESEERGQLPMKPCVQGSLPAAACDDTVTSIKPQRSSFKRVAFSGAAEVVWVQRAESKRHRSQWVKWHKIKKQTLGIKTTCSKNALVKVNLSAAVSACCVVFGRSLTVCGDIKSD